MTHLVAWCTQLSALPGAARQQKEGVVGSPWDHSRVGSRVSLGPLVTGRALGPYAEVIAAPVLVRRPLPQANVAFIAVDSQASVVGGRSNWALPKVLARFDGDIGSASQATSTGHTTMASEPDSRRSGPCELDPNYCQLAPTNGDRGDLLSDDADPGRTVAHLGELGAGHGRDDGLFD